MGKKEQLICEGNKREIVYNLINSGLAGALVLVGSFASGSITWTGLAAAVAASLVVMLTKFKTYWDGEKEEYSYKSNRLLTFY